MGVGTKLILDSILGQNDGQVDQNGLRMACE
jgi:hypothetical protein